MEERFPYFEIREIQELKENSQNQNTRKSKSTWVNVWTPDRLNYRIQGHFSPCTKRAGSFGSAVGRLNPNPTPNPRLGFRVRDRDRLGLGLGLGLGVGLGLIFPTADPNEPARLVNG